ncbi:hypothetical protein [Micromonospora maris]|uniref:hypothetical protein n=1 Tax=Micromonospora maris TaxID=1003110 RepID=UPI002E0E9219|nr:hypothetical protein OG712_15085 [Micromonospora maris]
MVVPGSDLVRRLAPALGIRTADLFVIAGLPVPGDLASAWPTSPWDVRAIRSRTARILNAVGDGPYVSEATVLGLG